MSSKAVLHSKALARVKLCRVDSQALIEVLGMNAFGPPIAPLLLQGAAGELKKGLLNQVQSLSVPDTQTITGAASITSRNRSSSSPNGSGGDDALSVIVVCESQAAGFNTTRRHYISLFLSYD